MKLWEFEVDENNLNYEERGDYQDVLGLGPNQHPNISLKQRQFYKPQIPEKNDFAILREAKISLVFPDHVPYEKICSFKVSTLEAGLRQKLEA